MNNCDPTSMLIVLTAQKYKLSTWSGGTTTQLFVYPQDSAYQDRNFNLRISIATTQNEESTFTQLEGVDRVISILDGQMEIRHQDRYWRILRKYDIDRFKGEWTTTSRGKVRDFNLMLKGFQGDFYYSGGKESVSFEEKCQIFFVYCIQGIVEVKDREIKQGKLLIIKELKEKVQIKCIKGKMFYGYGAKI